MIELMDLKELKKEYQLVPGRFFSYNAGTKTITYVPDALKDDQGKLALLHEVAHAKLNHFDYYFDLELLEIEQAAWEETKKEALNYNIEIDEKHIQECLESYVHWTAKRATCPKCFSFGRQTDLDDFKCIDCDTVWKANIRKDRRVLRKIIK